MLIGYDGVVADDSKPEECQERWGFYMTMVMEYYSFLFHHLVDTRSGGFESGL